MKRNGFTLIEMFIAICVLCIIVVIALPMHAVLAKKSELMHAKVQLMTIKASEDKFKMEHGMYTTDTTRLASWKTGTKRYRFQVEYADTSRFKAQARGDMDNDKVYDGDVWSIDQSGTLTQIK